jgi:hypothetical protein
VACSSSQTILTKVNTTLPLHSSQSQVAELQRSVDFYTKSNLSLAVHNRELEHKIILAKQRLQQMNATGEVKEGDVSSGNVLSKPEEVEVIAVTASRESKPVAAVTDPLPVSTTATLVNVKAEQEKAQLTAAQALYNTMGFPPAAARNAANNFSQFAGTTGNSSTSSTDDASIKAEVAAALKIAAGAESGKKVADNVVVEVAADHDQYIEALHQVCSSPSRLVVMLSCAHDSHDRFLILFLSSSLQHSLQSNKLPLQRQQLRLLMQLSKLSTVTR